MVDAFDIAIRRARLRDRDDGLADIGIKDGRITKIAPRLAGKAVTEIDAHANLVTESFVNPHQHLCKVWTLPMMEEEALKTYQPCAPSFEFAMSFAASLTSRWSRFPRMGSCGSMEPPNCCIRPWSLGPTWSAASSSAGGCPRGEAAARRHERRRAPARPRRRLNSSTQ